MISSTQVSVELVGGFAMTQDELRYVTDQIRKVKSKCNDGKVADYIPELANASPNTLGLTIHKLRDNPHTFGDCHYMFTLQSISKVFTLILALMDCGEQKLFEKVGMEPTGDDFNSMIKLERVDPGKPFNPMINAGALAVTSLIQGDRKQKFNRILSLIRTLAADPSIGYNHVVYESEIRTADLNRSLAYYLKQNKVIEGDVDELVDVYSRHCSIEVNCQQLARMALVLSNEGLNPTNDKPLIPKRYVQIAKVFMTTCGMYNASGEFAIRVGLPAKSGVSGGVMAIVPGEMGIGVIGPALDNKGNSTKGMEILKQLSMAWGLSIY